ncbi:aminotransferase class V-fold PLP-dependent enzyme [Desulfosarcina ovata]|nr:aminotransferase class V-fold PLP-dependent enzyme [Desulfosarcina ovata]
MIYLDNAATSFPKPAECLRRALDLYLTCGASPGRGGYDRAVEAEAMVQAVRDKIAGLFGAARGARVCFAANATDALNTLILGLLETGDHVVTTRLEHNSVLRPLNHLQQSLGIGVEHVPFNKSGFVEPDRIDACLRPETRVVIVNHASNVLGTVQPVAAIGAICKARGIPLVVDASQSAGCIPILMEQWGITGLAFTGHKSLLGPTGTGGLVLAPDLDLAPSRFGGSGVDSMNPFQPDEYPFRLEAGTSNLLGILGLGESIDFVAAHMERFREEERRLTARLVEGLRAVPSGRIHLFAADAIGRHLPVVTCRVDGIASSDVGAILDGDFEIAVRTGLHCAPLVHADLGTAPSGAVRFSLGPFTTEADIDAAIRAMAAIAG